MKNQSNVAYDKLSALFPVRKNIKMRRDGDFLLVMSVRHELVYLNDTACFLYEHFDGRTSVDDVFNLLRSEYVIGTDMEDEVRSDIVNTVRDFQWQSIVELRRSSA